MARARFSESLGYALPRFRQRRLGQRALVQPAHGETSGSRAGMCRSVFYLNASCTDESAGKGTRASSNACWPSAGPWHPAFQLLLFGFDWARDDAGAPMQDRSTFHVPDDYVAGLRSRHPAHFRGRPRSIRTTRVRSIDSTPRRRAERGQSSGCRRHRTSIRPMRAAIASMPSWPRCGCRSSRMPATSRPCTASASTWATPCG